MHNANDLNTIADHMVLHSICFQAVIAAVVLAKRRSSRWPNAVALKRTDWWPVAMFSAYWLCAAVACANPVSNHCCCSDCTVSAAAACWYPDTVSVGSDKAMTHWIVSSWVAAHKAMSVIADMENFQIDTVSVGFDKAMSDSIRPMNCNRNLVTLAAYIDHNTMGSSC